MIHAFSALARSPDGDAVESMASLTGAEVLAASALSLLASAIVVAYLADRSGRTIAPFAILPLSVAAAGTMTIWLRGGARWQRGEIAAFAAIVAAVLAWLLKLAWPALLPVGRGADVTHHLLLIDYIERHWRLVHEARVEAYLGEMVHYTPGSHLLAALAGAWTGTDGLHAVYPVVAFSVALKAGFVFLIALRLMPRDVPRIPLAVTSILLLFWPRGYFIGSFERSSFFAQVVAELFAVGMWWALVVWDEQPSKSSMGFFALSGAAVFLTWPVWIGPPLLVLLALALAREGLTANERLGYLILGVGPIAAVATAYIVGRFAWVGYVRAGGAVLRPSPNEFGWWFLLLSAVGMAIATARRRSRGIALLAAAIGAQALALFVLTKGNGAGASYMALKMVYLAVYPLAVAASLTLAAAWQAVVRVSEVTTGGALLRGCARERLAWALVMLLGIAVARPLVAAPLPKPVISEPLYLAGQWALAHVQSTCVEYLVPDDDTAYWLHLAVLGNPRMSARTADDDTFVWRAAIVRWIMPRGLPFAIADLPALPKDVREELDVLAQFGPAAVVKRRGDSRCPEGQLGPTGR
jgi:hypothetical protein